MTTPVLQLVRDRLVAETSVTDLVGTRIYAGEAPQGAVPPYAVCSRISSVDENVLGGAPTLGSTRVQIDCYAKTYPESAAAGEAIKNVLVAVAVPGLRVVRLGGRDLTERTSIAKFRDSADYAVWVRASS